MAELQIESNFPKEFTANAIALSFEGQSKGAIEVRREENL